MAIYKFQRSRLTFDLSALVAHIGVTSIYQNIVFSQTIGPIELKFHVKTPYDNFKAAYSVTMNIFRNFLFSFLIICKSRIKLCFHNKNVQYS